MKITIADRDNTVRRLALTMLACPDEHQVALLRVCKAQWSQRLKAKFPDAPIEEHKAAYESLLNDMFKCMEELVLAGGNRRAGGRA